MADPAFVQKLKMIQQQPALAESMLSGDPRLIDILGVLMGIDMQSFNREDGSDELPPGFAKAEPEPQSPPQPTASTSTSTPKPAPPPPASSKDEDVEMDDEEAKVRKDAEEEKKQGNAAYKARDFPTAAAHFQKAWDLWPKDVTFLTNLSGAYAWLCWAISGTETFEQPSISNRAITTSVSRYVKKLSKRVVRYVFIRETWQ